MNKKLFAFVILILVTSFAANNAAARGFSAGGFRSTPSIHIAPRIVSPTTAVHTVPPVKTAKVATPTPTATPSHSTKVDNSNGNKPPKPPVTEKLSWSEEKPGRPTGTAPATTTATQG